MKLKSKSLEIFIPGPAGRLEAKYYKNPKFGSPVAIVLHPHPQYGGTMNNRIVQLMYNIFLENGFSVIKVNFRGVGKSDGIFDNGQGDLLYMGSVVGKVDYEKGHCSWTVASLPEAEFKVHGQSNSAHSGGVTYVTSQYNSIQEIKARSINSIKNTTIEAIVLG